MTAMRRWLAVVCLVPLLVPDDAAAAVPGATDWARFKTLYILDSGRVVDTGNGGISHSEGQGYGMILALAFDDRAAFARLWDWTRVNLQVRDDPLLAWRWDPVGGRVDDVNNASDGDLLAAWALGVAGRRWNDAAYLAEARRLAEAIRSHLIIRHAGYTLLLPGIHGFVHEERVTVNPSYWVFTAIQFLSRFDPNLVWDDLMRGGLALLVEGRFTRHRLPPDWLALEPGRPPVPSPIKDPVFGYNALRVPLYLLWAGIRHVAGNDVLAYWASSGSRPPPVVTDLASGAVRERYAMGGIAAIQALGRCATGEPVGPGAFALGEDDPYYPSALRLLSLIAARRYRPDCLW